MSKSQRVKIPLDGLPGLKENWSKDLLSGFLVSLLALPLSLGIAKASGFPAIMGLLTAILGGMLVSLIAGSRLTIKGPAAGLIVICSGAVEAFGMGNDELGWHLTLGAIVVASVIQMAFGIFKLGKLSDFFPLSVIHGMLAAIGLIIISKQTHNLLGIDPKTLKGLEPLELYAKIPESLLNFNLNIGIIGFVSLAIVFLWPLIKNPFLKKIPAPLVVLAFSIPAGLFFDFKQNGPDFALVKIGNIFDSLKWNVDFSGMTSQPGIFIQFVVMFALIGSIESLLTVKAIDLLDPFHRKSNFNKDLVAVGAGNAVSGILGGLPMISEVARSSANVANGAKTRWANFFHGFSLLIFVVLAVPVIELIPNAALAALLIGVGYKLAHPKEFIHTYEIGKEQLIVFLVTIFFTLGVDLLVGVAAGILTKLVAQLIMGGQIKHMFKMEIFIENQNDHYVIKINQSAVFSNFFSLNNQLMKIPSGKIITLDISEVKFIDHSVFKNLNMFKSNYEREGGKFEIIGGNMLRSFSKHPESAKGKR